MEIFGWIIAFVVAITFHEAAHAWMADRLGDPTARLMGRLSLNPLVHYDPIGTTLLLVLVFMKALGAPVIPFGWAKPVRFDPYNLKNPRRDSALISLAGPVSNLTIALISAIVLRVAMTPFSSFTWVAYIFAPLVVLNVILAVFNLIPIHPLDGGKILIGLLPEKDAHEADIFLQRYGMIILFLLIFPTFGGTSPLSALIGPIVDFILKILLPTTAYLI